MSEPTYRIEVTFDPQNKSYPWDARVYRLSDGGLAWFTYGESPAVAEASARDMISRATHADAGHTVFVGDDGQDVPGYSVKV